MGEPIPNRDLLTRWTRDMWVIRRVEEMAQGAYQARKIRGFLHLYIGQEAVGVGALAALRPDDVVVTAYRDHGIALARGVPAREVMAELYGRSTGVSKGQGGSMHMASAQRHLYGGYGIVGGHVPLGAGAALAFQYRKEDRVSLTFFGDGAANQGAVFEALALAQLWRLPAVFVCENNLYAMGTSIERSSYLTDMSARADGVGMKRWRFDAYDVVTVHDEITKAVDFARSGQGPVLVEATCYRYRGHSMSDPGKYRALDEIEDYKRTKDCLMRAEGRLRELGTTEAELAAMHEEVEAVVADAIAFADTSPEPDPSVLYDFTYTGGV